MSKGPPLAPRNGNGNGNGNNSLPALSENTVRELIAQQAREAQLRSQELQIRKQELDYQSKHASEILGAQERDRASERHHYRTMERYKMFFIGAISAGLFAFAAWGLYVNKEQIVRDVLQILLSAVVGAFGGYGYAKARQAKPDEEQP